MTSTAVNNSVFQTARIAATTGKAQKSGDINQNFGDVFNTAGKNLQQSDTQQTQTKQTVNADKAAKPVGKESAASQNVEKPENIENTDVADKTQAAAQEAEPIDEELAEEVNEAVKQIIEKLKKILGISDDELMSALESLGMQPIDLLNSELMPQLMSAITGEDVITLVADESMYTALNEIIGAVDETAAELMQSTGLTDDELDAVLSQLKGLAANADEPLVDVQTQILPDDSQKSDTDADVQGAGKDIQTTADADEQVSNEETQDAGPKVIVEDKTTLKANTNAASNEQPLSEEKRTETITVEEKKQTDNKDSHSNAKNFENNQSGFEQSSQNKFDNTLEAATEIKPQSYVSENTYNIIRQLADTVKILRTEQLTQMEMQLHPASLGTVNVSLTTKGGVLTAEFITQNEAVKAAIEAQAVQLRENLEQQGIKVEAVEVSVASHQMEKNLDQNGQEQRSAEQQETQRVQGLRRRSINFNSFENGEELAGEYDGADDATRIAMEMMSMNGASMDLLA